jgi:hypothetical protein
MRAGRHQSGRLGAGHFLRKLGPLSAPARKWGATWACTSWGMRPVCRLKAFAQPSHRSGHALQRQQSAAQTRHGGGDDEEVFGPGRLPTCVQRAAEVMPGWRAGRCRASSARCGAAAAGPGPGPHHAHAKRTRCAAGWRLAAMASAVPQAPAPMTVICMLGVCGITAGWRQPGLAAARTWPGS